MTLNIIFNVVSLYLVFGVLAINCSIPTKITDIYRLGPITLWTLVKIFKKYPSFVYIFMRDSNQIHDKILVRSGIGQKLFEQVFIYRSYSMGEASHMKQNRTPKLCMKLIILFLVSYLLYDL